MHWICEVGPSGQLRKFCNCIESAKLVLWDNFVNSVIKGNLRSYGCCSHQLLRKYSVVEVISRNFVNLSNLFSIYEAPGWVSIYEAVKLRGNWKGAGCFCQLAVVFSAHLSPLMQPDWVLLLQHSFPHVKKWWLLWVYKNEHIASFYFTGYQASSHTLSLRFFAKQLHQF